MARAFTGKTRAEQFVNHAVTSTITYLSTCRRCGGLMVSDFCMDLLNSPGELEFAAKRCVQCGEVVDPVILRNRRTGHELILAPSAHVRSQSSTSQEAVR